MKKYSAIFCLAFALSIVLFSSCKKKDPEDDSRYMTGFPVFDLPSHLLVNTPLTLEASGITDPESGLEYKWTTTGFSVDSIAGQSVTINTPATWGSYTVILTISHPDYVNKVVSKSTSVIDITSPESFSGVATGPGMFTDIRDGRVYNYVKIGKLNWFTSNLKWKQTGQPYNFTPALSEIYGMLYTWNQATGGVAASGLANGPKGVCPEGWSIPTREDWENLGLALNSSAVSFDSDWPGLGSKATAKAVLNGNGIWKYSPNNNGENTLGWNALPGGSSTNNFKSFANISLFGFWWSASQRDSANGEYRFIHFDNANFPYNYAGKAFFGASVRCVQLAD